MALEGDGCFLCRPTEIAVNKIASELSPVRFYTALREKHNGSNNKGDNNTSFFCFRINYL